MRKAAARVGSTEVCNCILARLHEGDPSILVDDEGDPVRNARVRHKYAVFLGNLASGEITQQRKAKLSCLANSR